MIAPAVDSLSFPGLSPHQQPAAHGKFQAFFAETQETGLI
jgi:hypothetical protein